jgi:hypothetical protein
MALSLNAKTYTADGWDQNSVRFQGPLNTTSVKDRLIQKVTPAKATDVSSGQSRFMLMLTRTHTLTGAKAPTGDGSTKIDIVRPVGISNADSDAYCDDLGAYIASAGFKAALKSLQPNG